LAGGIAHDFNNLLMAIMGNADLALRRVSKKSSVWHHISSILQTTSHATELCKQLLAYSGKGKFVTRRIDLNDIIEGMTQLLEVSLLKRSQLSFHPSSDLPAIEADATQIRQVVMNLVTNAAEAISNTSGTITIATSVMRCDQPFSTEGFVGEPLPKGDYVYLEVKDTGSGMDQETLDKIFDPFFSTKFTGRGLGLSAVQGIVTSHGGAMTVESEKGKGTTFRVLFPSLKKPADISADKPLETEKFRGSGTILLVDDDSNVLGVINEMLKEIGFDVLTAPDGPTAIKLFGEHQDDIVCVLLDLTMPIMNGKEIFKALRRMKKDIRIILSSGYNEQEITTQFTGKRLAGFIQKPYKLDDIIPKLKKILS